MNESRVKRLQIDQNAKDLWLRISNEVVVDSINWFSLEYLAENELVLSSVGENGLLEAKQTLRDEVVSFLVVNGCLIRGKHDFRTITLLVAWIPRFTTGIKRARSILHINEIVKFFGMKIMYIIEPRSINCITTKYVEKKVNQIRGISLSSNTMVGRYLFTGEATERRRKEANKSNILPVLKELLLCEQQIEKVQKQGIKRLREVFSTERFFLRSMNYFLTLYVDTIRKHGYRDLYLKMAQQLTVIVGVNVPLLRDFEKIYGISTELETPEFTDRLESLDTRFFTEQKISEIIDSFRRNSHNLQKYRFFASLYSEFLSEITHLLKKDADLAHSFKEIELRLKRMRWQAPNWNSFLIMPIQRPMRYQILLKDLSKDTLKTSSNHDKIKLALGECKKVIDTINSYVDEYSRTAKSKELAGTLKRKDLASKKVVGYLPIEIHYSPPQIKDELASPLSSNNNPFSIPKNNDNNMMMKTGNLLNFGDDEISKQQYKKKVVLLNKNIKEEEESINTTYKIRHGELFIFEDRLLMIKYHGNPEKMNPTNTIIYNIIGKMRIYRELDLRDPNLRVRRHPILGTMIMVECETETLCMNVRGIQGEDGIMECHKTVELINIVKNKCMGRESDFEIMKTQVTRRTLHKSKMNTIIFPNHIHNNNNTSSISSHSHSSPELKRRKSFTNVDHLSLSNDNDVMVLKNGSIDISADLRVRIYENKKVIQSFSILGSSFGKIDDPQQQQQKQQQIRKSRSSSNFDGLAKRQKRLSNSPSNERVCSLQKQKEKRKSSFGPSKRKSRSRGGFSKSEHDDQLSVFRDFQQSKGMANDNSNNDDDFGFEKKDVSKKKVNKMRYCWFYISPPTTTTTKIVLSNDSNKYMFQTNGSIVDLENWIGILEIIGMKYQNLDREDDNRVMSSYEFMSIQQRLMIEEEKNERLKILEEDKNINNKNRLESKKGI